MSQNKFEKPLALRLDDRQVFYSYAALILFLSSLSIFFFNALSFYNQLLCFLIVLLFLLFSALRRRHNRVTEISLNSDNEIKITTSNENSYEVDLTGECIVTYRFLWLNFALKNNQAISKKFHTLILLNKKNKDDLRQLRVRLRLLYDFDEQSK